MNTTGAIQLNVGFVGHRNVLDNALYESQAQISASVTAVMRCMKQTERVDISQNETDEQVEFAYTLISGYAPGADRLACEYWQDLNLGKIHIIMPFLDEDPDVFGWTADPKKNYPESKVSVKPELVDTATILDGAAIEQESPRRSAHVEQGYWVLNSCDFLIALWNGERANGPGGTGDTIEMALRLGVPVIWIDPSNPETALHLPQPTDSTKFCFTEYCTNLKTLSADESLHLAATDASIASLIQNIALPNWLNDAHHHGDDTRPSFPKRVLQWLGLSAPDFDAAPDHHHLSERARHQLFRREMAAFEEDHSVRQRSVYSSFQKRMSRPFQLFGWVWVSRSKQTGNAARTPLHSDFAEDETLTAYETRVKRFSGWISDQHRSTQIIILRLAALAVVFGLSPVLLQFYDLHPHPDISLGFKWLCVFAELITLSAMFVVWFRAKRRQSHWLWSDARRYRERLRSLRATLPLGFDANRLPMSPRSSWSEWLIWRHMRSIGLPDARMTKAETLDRAKIAQATIVESQAEYHNKNARQSQRIHSRIENTELFLFVFLFLCLSAFVVLIPMFYFGTEKFKLDYRIGNGILFLSAVLPALGASCMALSAQLELTSAAKRSSALAPEFERLRDRLSEEIQKGEDAAISEINSIVKQAASLATTDVDTWNKSSERREIIRGP